MHSIDKDSIIDAHRRISEFIHRTPLLTSSYLNRLSGANLFFKCENFQKTGSFKVRGAFNAVLKLDKKKCTNGVATHSSGNHAQALAYAAQKLGIPAMVVMPRNSSQSKKDAAKGYGAQIVECEPTLEARESMLEKIVRKTDAKFIPPYNSFDTIEGQSTCGKEIIEELKDLDYIISPVGGGGLLSGTLLSAKFFGKNTRVIAAEPQGADDAYRSWKAGKIVTNKATHTIADGLLTNLGDKTFPIIKEYVHRIITVSDEEILRAMTLIWERMKIIVEPSGAVSLAALLNEREYFLHKRVAIILSGGNVDLGKLNFNFGNSDNK